MRFNISFSDSQAFRIGFSGSEGFPVKFDSMNSSAKYQGAYEFTSSAETQTVETAGLVLEENIIIDPIPDNYGLITWDGSTITVS